MWTYFISVLLQPIQAILVHGVGVGLWPKTKASLLSATVLRCRKRRSNGRWTERVDIEIAGQTKVLAGDLASPTSPDLSSSLFHFYSRINVLPPLQVFLKGENGQVQAMKLLIENGGARSDSTQPGKLLAAVPLITGMIATGLSTHTPISFSDCPFSNSPKVKCATKANINGARSPK